MSQDCSQSETDVLSPNGPLDALVAWFRREVAYRQLVRDLQQLSPELLADINLRRGDIRRFARAATDGKAPAVTRLDDGPATTIGSAEWSRAYLLRLGSN